MYYRVRLVFIYVVGWRCQYCDGQAACPVESASACSQFLECKQCSVVGGVATRKLLGTSLPSKLPPRTSHACTCTIDGTQHTCTGCYSITPLGAYTQPSACVCSMAHEPPPPPQPPPALPPPLPPGWACTGLVFPAPHYTRGMSADGDILAVPVTSNGANYPDAFRVLLPTGFQQGDVATISLLARSAASSPVIFGCAGGGGFLRLVVPASSNWIRLTNTDTFKFSSCTYEHRLAPECSSVTSAAANPAGATGTSCSTTADGQIAFRNLSIVAGGPQCLNSQS